MANTQMCIHDNKLADMRDLPIYPIHYFQRGKKCDLDWIIKLMRNIPTAKRRGIATEYEAIFKHKGGEASTNRDNANKFLLKKAKEFRAKADKRAANIKRSLNGEV